jgi:hypothetical protein
MLCQRGKRCFLQNSIKMVSKNIMIQLLNQFASSGENKKFDDD